jgi:transcriptional regulator with XRE-family HTH domain
MTTGNGNERVHLAALIQAKRDRGDSYRDIARRAQAAGYDISHSYVDTIHKGTVQRAPKDNYIEALAAGLEIPVERVRRAMTLDYFGYDPGEGTEVLPDDIQDLLDSIRARLLRAPTAEAREPIAREFWKLLGNMSD